VASTFLLQIMQSCISGEQGEKIESWPVTLSGNTAGDGEGEDLFTPQG
jgi:hypothetical protein